MYFALIHDSQLLLGPIKYNYRLINSELEDLGIKARIFSKDYERVPMPLDEKTKLLHVIQNIPEHDSRFQSIGNFEWTICSDEFGVEKVEMNYTINNKSLEQIKQEYKSRVAPMRWEKENKPITLTINNIEVLVSTNREERLLLASKLIADPGPHNYKFSNTWLEITTEQLQTIVSAIDVKVQEAFDWEHSKLQEIDACSTGEEVYNVVLE